ncbi:MAG: exodeoxyribonuclease VII large subunit, partial [Mangrovicoccus sp.]
GRTAARRVNALWGSDPSQPFDRHSAPSPWTAERSNGAADRWASRGSGASFAQAGPQTTRLPLAFTHRQAARQSGLSALSGRLSLRPAMAALSQGQRRLPEASTRLAAAWPTRRDAWASQLAGLERLRISLGYEATLKRGFAVVRDDKDAVLTSAAAAGKAKGLSLQFQDGRIDLDAAAPSPTEKPKRKAPSKAAAKSKQSPKGQASLFDD